MRIFFIILMSIQILQAQTGYTISVESIPNANKAYLYYLEDTEYKYDSCSVENNKFEFKGSVNYPTMATLDLNDNKGNNLTKSYFYIENSDIQITNINADPIILNSRTENLKNEFLQKLSPVKERMHILENNYKNKPQTDENKRKLIAQQQILDDMNIQIISDFVKAHSSDFFSLYLLQTLIENETGFSEASNLYKGLSQPIQESKLGIEVKNKLDKTMQLALGAIAPDFNLEDINGNRFNLSDFRGKYVLLEFWASDCGYCQYEQPNIKNIYETFKDQNFVVVAIGQDHIDRKTDWEKYVKDNGFSWINAFDERVDGKKKLAQLYDVKKLPSNFILNPKGQIIAKDILGDDLLRQITFLMQVNKKK